MTTHVVNTHEAKSRLSGLIREAEEGVEVLEALAIVTADRAIHAYDVEFIDARG